jgi:hypothetical protein
MNKPPALYEVKADAVKLEELLPPVKLGTPFVLSAQMGSEGKLSPVGSPMEFIRA